MNVPRTPSPGEECCICLERIEKEDSKIWGCDNWWNIKRKYIYQNKYY